MYTFKESEYSSKRKEYIQHLNKLPSKSAVYRYGFLWLRTYTAEQMIQEMKNKTAFSKKILNNILTNNVHNSAGGVL